VSRYVAVLALLLLVLMPGVDTAAPPDAPVEAAQPGLLPEPASPVIEPSYRDSVYGDFLLAGNSVLRCPVGDETPGDNTPQTCAAATAGEGPADSAVLDNSGNNNGYFMYLADDDGRDDTFSSSRAVVNVPAGATVKHAQLTWGGHTGRFIGFSGVNCMRPVVLQGDAPQSEFAAATPAEQEVGIAVAGGEPQQVVRDPAHFRATDGLDETSQLYTDWADVTSSFAGVTGGAPIEVSVSNVWAPTGPGCAAGWSLAVVYDFGARNGQRPRVVDIYNDQLPQTGVLLPGLIEPLLPGVPEVVDEVLPGLVPAATGTSVTLPGVSQQPANADAAIGLTAFDGDWRQGGDTFTVNGNPVAEPCSGEAGEGFFRSCATGAVDPIEPTRQVRNTMSIDAKTVRPALDGDTGNVEIGVRSTGDFFVLGSVVLAESLDPAVSITMTGPDGPVSEGSLGSYDIDVTNTGGLPLTDIVLTLDPGVVCAAPARLPDLAPGGTTRVNCVRALSDPGQVTTTATVAAGYVTHGTGTGSPVTATATSAVEVLPADYTVERMPDRLVVRTGGSVTFTVTLGNNTDADLTDLTYTDVVENCQAAAAGVGTVLPAHGTLQFTCAYAPTATAETWGGMRGTGPAGGVSVDSDRVRTSVIDPVVAVTAAADKDTFYRGDSVVFTFVVTNSSDQPEETLYDVTVSAGDLCATEPVSSLAPGEQTTVSCTAQPAESWEVTATVTGSDVTGTAVTATAPPVPITVLEPLIQLTQQVDRPTLRVGDEAHITFTVTHVGAEADGPVHDLRITSPTLPPSCNPEPVAELAVGAETTAECWVVPDRTFDNQAFAEAFDQSERRMKVGTDPLRVTVINPMLAINTAANPEQTTPGSDVEFSVVVRNIGDVPLTVEVTNEPASDCDFPLSGEGLPAGAAHGVQCVATAPGDGATELTNTATYTAKPLGRTGDTGEPLTGTAETTVTLVAGEPQPAPGADPSAGGDQPGGGGPGDPGGGAGAPGGPGGSDDGGLAWTGASIAVPLGFGISMLVLGGLTLMATSRRRHDENSMLYRWWPSD
jgi:hypothetical protein